MVKDFFFKSNVTLRRQFNGIYIFFIISIYIFLYTGSYLGPLIGLQLSGFLASSNAGWPSIFYITGGMNCLWSFIWFWIGASSPDEHKFISTNEKNYIKEQSENSLNKDKVYIVYRNDRSSFSK